MSLRWGSPERPIATTGGLPATVLLAVLVIAACAFIAGALL